MRRAPRQQRGIVAVLVAVALLALLAMAGLAIDTGHLVLNKSRLQSAVDAAALAAAMELNQTGSKASAQDAAEAVFSTNAGELSGVLTAPEMRPLDYSDTLMGFKTGSKGQGRNYVRVVADSFTMWTSFAKVLGISELATAASAVAGPSAPLKIPGACDVVPLRICAKMPGGTKANGWGVLDPTKVTPLKIAVADTSEPGNSGLICLEDSNCGMREIEYWLKAGGCIPPSGILTTKPGTGTGPTGDGLAARFDKSGLPKYPPDQVTDQVGPPALTMQKKDEVNVFFCADGTPDKCTTIGEQVTSIDQVHINYSDYKARYSSKPPDLDEPGLGVADRRVVALPVVDCGEHQGRHDEEVLDLACFFLLQDIIRVPGNPAYILGQYTNEPCVASGTPGSTPGSDTGTGVFKIVLHNDPNSDDS